MSIAVQFGDRVNFPPLAGISAFNSVKERMPLIELKERVGVLGVDNPMPVISTSDAVTPRWFFSSESGAELLQLQDDLVAYNWRKRFMMASGEEGPTYPGYEVMRDTLRDHIGMWMDVTGTGALPSVSCCHLLYDNIWPIDATSKVGNVFAFWKTLGIQGRFIGPEVKWNIGVDSDFLTSASRIELNASVGQVQLPNSEPVRAARVALSSYAFLTDQVKLWDAYDCLHEHVHRYLNLLVTEDTRRAWHE